MAKNAGSGGNQFMFAVASVFLIVLMVLAYRSCGSRGTDDAVLEAQLRQRYTDSLQAAEEAAALEAQIQAEAQSRAEALMRARTQPPLGDSLVRDPSGAGYASVVRQPYTPLYVCTDFANLRSGPSLKHGKVERLTLFDQVEYLNERTDSTYRIDLGEITPNAPWVKVKTQSGKEGWIYGACVHYYKYRLDGVETD